MSKAKDKLIESELEFLINYDKVYENKKWKPIIKDLIHTKDFQPLVIALLENKEDSEKPYKERRRMISFTKKDKSMAFDLNTFWLLSAKGRLMSIEYMDDKTLENYVKSENA